MPLQKYEFMDDDKLRLAASSALAGNFSKRASVPIVSAVHCSVPLPVLLENLHVKLYKMCSVCKLSLAMGHIRDTLQAANRTSVELQFCVSAFAGAALRFTKFV